MKEVFRRRIGSSPSVIAVAGGERCTVQHSTENVDVAQIQTVEGGLQKRETTNVAQGRENRAVGIQSKQDRVRQVEDGRCVDDDKLELLFQGLQDLWQFGLDVSECGSGIALTGGDNGESVLPSDDVAWLGLAVKKFAKARSEGKSQHVVQVGTAHVGIQQQRRLSCPRKAERQLNRQ